MVFEKTKTKNQKVVNFSETLISRGDDLVTKN